MDVSYAVCRDCPRLRAKHYDVTGWALGCDRWISDGIPAPAEPDRRAVERFETCVVLDSCDRLDDYENIRKLRQL